MLHCLKSARNPAIPCVLQYMSVKNRSFCGRIEPPRKGAFTMNYSKELKDALLRRMLPPNNESITKISKEEGISEQHYETGVAKPEETATLHREPMPFQTIEVRKTNSLLLCKLQA